MTIKARVKVLERQAGIDKVRTVIVITDDYGHEEWPYGEAGPDDKVVEIHLGGVDIEKDF